MKKSLYLFGLISTIFLIRPSFGIIVHNRTECIYYFDESRPPVVEVYKWDEKKHWVLYSVKFDSDGDWYLDSSMYFIGKQERLTKRELATQKARDEEEHAIRKGGVKIAPFFEELKKRFKLYLHKDLYKALETDKSFRVDLDGYLRVLEPPLPQAEQNYERRRSQEYQDLLKELLELKLADPPQIPTQSQPADK